MKRLMLSMLCCSSLLADVTYDLLVDQYFSPYIGAEDIISAHKGLEYLQDWLLPPPTEPSRKVWPCLERFSELFFIWTPINALGVATQHEVFGHGFRVRTLRHEGDWVQKYKIFTPFPYGEGGGYCSYHRNSHKTTEFQDLTINSGGVEATAILANRLKLKWLQKGTINARESSLYTESEQDLSVYIWLSSNKHEERGNDISDYVRHLNKTYPKGHLTVKSLKVQAIANLLDPFTYYSIYGWWRYVVTGKQGRIPMIRIGSYKYIPGARLGLTPFGPEYYLDNFLVKDNKPIYFYARAGHYADQTYVGLGVEHAYIWNIDTLPWGLRLDCWYQPHAAFRDRRYSIANLHKEKEFHHQPHNPHVGISLSAIGHVKIANHCAFYFQIGGKTIGYLEGEPLQPYCIARVGLTFW